MRTKLRAQLRRRKAKAKAQAEALAWARAMWADWKGKFRTGRISNREPDLQTLLRPYQREMVRKIFAADYGKIELRMMHHYGS